MGTQDDEDRTGRAEKRPAATQPTVIGWREWIGLPDLGVAAIKAKIDTGARTSALHAWDVEPFRRRGRSMVRFKLHPFQRDQDTTVDAEAEVVEERSVRASSGHATLRPVIVTDVALLGRRFPIEVTLASRDAMGFRMLLGRQALRGALVVDPGRSFLGGRPKRRKRKKSARRAQDERRTR